NDEIQPRRQRAGVFAEPFDGPVITLGDRLDAGEQCYNDQQHDRDGENAETVHGNLLLANRSPETQAAPCCKTLSRIAVRRTLHWSSEPDVRFDRAKTAAVSAINICQSQP